VADWNKAYSISASLNLLFQILSLEGATREEASCDLPQLMLLNAATVRNAGGRGYSLSGSYSKALAYWFEKGGTRVIPEMISAMHEAHSALFGSLRERWCFDAAVNDSGWLRVSCEGSAYGLLPEHARVKTGMGSSFYSYDVNSPTQQITLLAGLAALHDLADREIRTPLA